MGHTLLLNTSIVRFLINNTIRFDLGLLAMLDSLILVQGLSENPQ